MKKTIQELKSGLNLKEQLSVSQLCFVKGGDGEDIRRPNLCGRIGNSGTGNTGTTGNPGTSNTGSVNGGKG